jgi:hypothetical protein
MVRSIQRCMLLFFAGLLCLIIQGCAPSIRTPSGGFHAERGPARVDVSPTLDDGRLDLAVNVANTSDILAVDIAHADFTLLSPSLVEIPPRLRPSCTPPVLLAGEAGSCTFSYDVSRTRPLPLTWEASIDGNIFQFRFEE